MEDEDFITNASLICEPARAKILWKLIDGRAYTASELAIYADLSSTSASNHLNKLLKGNILKVDIQGRHRYYSYATNEIAYVIEALASLSDEKHIEQPQNSVPKTGMKYCRTCYDHLAGYVGVRITDAMIKKEYLKNDKNGYSVTVKGWEWLNQINITESLFYKSRRPLTRQCLDWSERRPHLAGHLGAVFLNKTLEDHWFKKVKFSREIIITAKGRMALHKFLDLQVQ